MARMRLGWAPKVELVAGLTQTIDYFRVLIEHG
jgi:nucleoside-diphosphate-sugar epimerase